MQSVDFAQIYLPNQKRTQKKPRGMRGSAHRQTLSVGIFFAKR